MKLGLILFVFCFSCCETSQIKKAKRTLSFENFSLEIPDSWHLVKRNGIDSYVGTILIDSSDCVSFNLGNWASTLTEPDPVIMLRSSLVYHENLDTTEIVLVDDDRWIDHDEYRKQNLTWDTIDKKEAKIVYPRKAGQGTTGVYFDSLWNGKNGVESFSMSGDNLKLKNQKLLLEAIRTLKFFHSN